MPTLSNGRKIQNGGDIMLFYYNGSAYTSIAHATSHQLSLSTQTESINSKDYGKFGATEVSQITWEITSDHMYTSDGFDTFYSYMLADTTANPTANQLKVVFGLKKSEANKDAVNTESTGDGNWIPTTSTYVYSGDAVVSSLNVSADNGSKATISATLSGIGPISRVQLS